ncbi:MAG: hypothetical protein ACFB00_10330 [Parvularculaceae bacterium]
MAGARESILKATISGRFRDALAALEEQLDADVGRDAAHEWTVRVTAAAATGKRDFVVRACVFLWVAAARADVDLIALLCAPATPPRRLRTLFQGAPATADGFAVGPTGLQLEDATGAYRIAYGRTPFLMMFSVFIANLAGYDALVATRDEAVASRTVRGVGAAATGLAARLNGLIAADMPTGHAMRKFLFLIERMEARCGAGFPREAVDDDAVFDVWGDALETDDGSIGLRRFVSCAAASETLLETWAEGAAALAEAGAGELSAFDAAPSDDPENDGNGAFASMSLAMLAGDGLQPRLRALMAAMEATQLKCLTKAQAKTLSALLGYADAARALDATRLRANVFGPGQARLSAAIGRGATAGERAALIEDRAPASYHDVARRAEKALDDLERALWGVGWILLANRRVEAVSHLLSLADADLIDAQDETDAEEALVAAENAVRRGETPALIGRLAPTAEKAFKKLSRSRQGFEADRLTADETVDAALRIAEAFSGETPALRRRLAQVERAARARSFETDAQAFRLRFQNAYAGG